MGNSNADFVDYYALLGVEPTAEIAEIRRAYIQKAKFHHPDAGGETQQMQSLNRAYKTLTSSDKKAAYDLLHSIEIGSTATSDYRYGGGREISSVEDMTDDEIDGFLDGLMSEYTNEREKTAQSIKQKFKSYLKKL